MALFGGFHAASANGMLLLLLLLYAIIILSAISAKVPSNWYSISIETPDHDRTQRLYLATISSAI